MKKPTQPVRPGPRPFWKRILERYKFRGRLLRARIPLVLFRFRTAGASRQAHRGARDTVVPFNLQLQVFMDNESGRRAMIERSLVTQSITRELKPVWRDPRRAERSASPLSHEAAFHSESIAPISFAGRATGSVAPINNNPAFEPPKQVAIIPDAFRFSQALLNNKLHKAIAGRKTLAASEARIHRFAPRRKSVSAAGAWPSPLEAESTVALSRSVTHPYRKSGAVMDSISARGQSEFIHSGRAEEAPPAWLAGVRSRLFAESASLKLAGPSASGPTTRPQAAEQTSAPRPPSVQPSQPQLDMGRLSDEVYRHIQRKIRVERERRGM